MAAFESMLAEETPGVMARAGSKLKSIMGKAANLSMPAVPSASAGAVGRAVGTASRVAPGATALAGVDLGARALTAGLNNVVGPGDDNIEGMQAKLQTDPLAQYLPTWLDQAARGAESLVARGGDLLTEGTLSGSGQRSIQRRDEKMLGLDDASMEANGKLDPATMAILNARKTGAVQGLPEMEDLTPAREQQLTNTNPYAATGKAIMKENTLFEFDKAERSGRTAFTDQMDRIQSSLSNGSAGQGDAAALANMGMKLARFAGGQKVAQQNADTGILHEDVAQRGQDMTFAPLKPKVQIDSAIAAAVAGNDLDTAHRLATLGKTTDQPSTHVQSGDLASDTPAGLWVGDRFIPAPTAKELALKKVRDQQIKKVNTAATGVRG